MIGYYVHHHGLGHLHRAEALVGELVASGEEVTGISSLPRPASWGGPWLQLPRDDTAAVPVDPTAAGHLHWVPVGDQGHRERMASLSRWIDEMVPSVVVVDVSAEVALLVRLHGVRVVSMVLPGSRTDSAHLTAFHLSSALVAAWPEEADARDPTMTPGLPEDLRARLVRIGGVSRFPPASVGRGRPGPRRAVVLQGRGGGRLTEHLESELNRLVRGWEWTVLGGREPWTADPSATLLDADVVVTCAGLGSLADIAACRRPAVVVPAERPYAEQAASAAVLADSGWPVVVARTAQEALSPSVLDRAGRMDGNGWASWCDGDAARRFAALVADVAAGAGPEETRQVPA
ncbi:MAG: hypothetical protein JWR85_2652 [Marmoricola sp.]|nr:hypothetical protein [Marmoricola sp.]